LKAERTRKEAKKLPGPKRKAAELEDENPEEREIESPMDMPGAAASPVQPIPASIDMQAAFQQFLATMSSRSGVALAPADSNPEQENKRDAKHLERARLKAEKDATKAEKEAIRAQKKEAAKAAKAAENCLALAAKAVAGLASLSTDLAAVKIPKDTPEVIADPVMQAKSNIASMVKASRAVITASKRKDFASNTPTLDFDAKQMAISVGEARAAMKKLQDYVQLVGI